MPQSKGRGRLWVDVYTHGRWIGWDPAAERPPDRAFAPGLGMVLVLGVWSEQARCKSAEGAPDATVIAEVSEWNRLRPADDHLKSVGWTNKQQGVSSARTANSPAGRCS